MRGLAAEQEGEAALESENPFKLYEEHQHQSAKEAFSKHVIKSKGDGRWVISSRYDDGSWCNFYLAEIIVGVYGTLIVHGDISAVIFAHYGGYTEPLQVVQWVARSGISGYLECKARIGLTVSEADSPMNTFNEDCAIWEIKSHIEDRLREMEDDESSTSNEINDPEISAWRKAIRSLKSGDCWDLIRIALYEELEEAWGSDAGEIVFNIGIVPAPRLYYAQEACRKLLELLEQEK